MKIKTYHKTDCTDRHDDGSACGTVHCDDSASDRRSGDAADLCNGICGYVLGWKLSASSALYLILGAIGVPVYAGMSGGFGALLGPAGGFIFGFIPMAMLCGAGTKASGKPFVQQFLNTIK